MLLMRDPGTPRTVRVAENLTINAASGIAIDPTGTRFSVGVPADLHKHNVEIRTTSDNALSGTVSLPDEAVAGLVLAPDGGRLFVATWTSPIGGAAKGTLTVIDTATKTVTTTVPLPGLSRALAVSHDGSRVYVTVESNLEVIDPAAGRSVAGVALGGRGEGGAVTPDGRRALIATPGGNAVATLDLESAMVTGAIPVGERPEKSR